MVTPKMRLKKYDGSDFSGWEEVPFGELIESFSDKTKKNNEDILLSSAIDGMFLNSELYDRPRSDNNIGYLKIKKGTLILSAQNLHLGNANVNMRFEHGIISPAYKTFNITGCMPEFMAQWIKRDNTKKFFFDVTTTGASQCRRNVEWDSLMEQPIMIPSEEEQKAIVDFFSLFDKKIDNQQTIVTALETRRKGFLQQILMQNYRFLDKDGNDFPDWEENSLDNYLYESKSRNKKNKYKKEDVLSVSKDFGIINQIKYLGKSMAGEDISNYRCVEKGDVVYTKSPLGKQPYGIIKYSDTDGVVSTLYAVYHCNENINPKFVDLYFSINDNLNSYLKPLVNIGAKHDMKVTNDVAISGTVCFPTSLEEQQVIIDFFEILDKQILVEKEKLELLKKKKSGFLQQMFI